MAEPAALLAFGRSNTARALAVCELPCLCLRIQAGLGLPEPCAGFRQNRIHVRACGDLHIFKLVVMAVFAMGVESLS